MSARIVVGVIAAHVGVGVSHAAVAITQAAVDTAVVAARAAVVTAHAVLGEVAGMLSSGAGRHEVAAWVVRKGVELLVGRLGGGLDADWHVAVGVCRRGREVIVRMRPVQACGWLSSRTLPFNHDRCGSRRVCGLGVNVFDLSLNKRTDNS